MVKDFTTSSSGANRRIEAELATMAMLNRHKPNDCLVLSDEALLHALQRTKPLSKNEYRALLDSPLTLRRMKSLMAAARAQKNLPIDAANDDSWSGSHGLLLAADSGATAPSLSTEDGWWRLVFLPAETGWSLVLKLDAAAPFRTSLIDGAIPVAVIDGNGQILLTGTLDSDAELEMPWPIPTAPYEHLMATGGHFKVLPA